ncbi:hypothetical protein [Curtobacterium sp. AB7]|uniref:hypothetical protein n=1 Tax=Curtobacterium sp. AB7 TaxID=3349327 RepID=UPI003834C95B
MSRMTTATMLRSEVRRAWLGRAVPYFLVFGVLLTALSAAGTFSGVTDQLRTPDGDVDVTVTMVRTWFALSLFIGMATAFDAAREVSSGVASRVITALGSRTAYFTGKAAIGALTGFVGALLGAAASVGFAAILLAMNDSALHMSKEAWLIVLGCAVINTVAGLWGTLIGLLTRNAIVAIIVVFALCMLVEPALQAFLPSVGKFFMTNAMASVYIDAQEHLLSVPSASAVIVGWLVVLGLGAFQLTRTKDLR